MKSNDLAHLAARSGAERALTQLITNGVHYEDLLNAIECSAIELCGDIYPLLARGEREWYVKDSNGLAPQRFSNMHDAVREFLQRLIDYAKGR